MSEFHSHSQCSESKLLDCKERFRLVPDCKRRWNVQAVSGHLLGVPKITQVQKRIIQF